MSTERICSHLEALLAQELDHGNVIGTVTSMGYANCDLVIELERPFAAHHDDDLPPGVIGYVNSDRHYPVGKGYFCTIDRHEVFGPQELRR